ncbi:MAG: hypothetical protein ACXAC6_18305 [Candidatus Hodarchaeales archaeon]|jgi:hypothetical protein
MTSKGIRHLTICLFAVTLLASFISVSLSVSQQEIPLDAPQTIEEGRGFQFENIEFRILQDDTSTTEEDEFPAWKPAIGKDMYYPLALLFSILGISAIIWLIFFVETSKERTIRERIIGTTIRLIVMSIFVGFAIHFWILFQPI